MTRPRYARAAAAAGLFVLLAGCGSGPKVVKVSGTVTRNGQPVPNAALSFTPSPGRPSWGMSDENGKFTLKYSINEDGAEVGRHKVTIDFPPATVQEEADLATGKKKQSADRKEILKKFGQKGSSTIEIEVSRSTDNLEVKLD